MPTTQVEQQIQRLKQGDLRTAAKIISAIEHGDDSITELLSTLQKQNNHIPIIGLTGPPGVGKSTLLDQLVSHYRAKGHKIAVLMFDPSSPITGGAILGDRLRLAKHNTDNGVFIRSMASRGQLGGLAQAANNSIAVLNALNFDLILIETVGVGQNEVDIMQYADSVLLVLSPDCGDGIQAIKAGVIEIGNIIAVNKADKSGVEKMVSALRETTHQKASDAQQSWQPIILKTIASKNEGIKELANAIEQHIHHQQTQPSEANLTQSSYQIRQQICSELSSLISLEFERNEQYRNKLNESVEKITQNKSSVLKEASLLLNAFK